MTLIDLGDFKIRFDPKEVRINIDGDMIDVGARRTEEKPVGSMTLKDLEPYMTEEEIDELAKSFHYLRRK